MAELEPHTTNERGQFTRIPLTPFSCYRAFVQAELIGVLGADARVKVAQLCLYAWDIALLPASNLRDGKIAELLDGMQTTAASDPDYRVWFVDTMQRLIARKRACFSEVQVLVDRSELTPQNDMEDQLIVGIGGSAEVFTIPVVSLGDAASVPDRLRCLRNNAADLSFRVTEAPPSGVTAYDIEQLQLQCGMWCAELDALKHAAWLMHGAQRAPSALRVTAEWQSLASDLVTELQELVRRSGRGHRSGLPLH
jgi:hypothetical protein